MPDYGEPVMKSARVIEIPLGVDHGGDITDQGEEHSAIGSPKPPSCVSEAVFPAMGVHQAGGMEVQTQERAGESGSWTVQTFPFLRAFN
jgi:hypothetical protein